MARESMIPDTGARQLGRVVSVPTLLGDLSLLKNSISRQIATIGQARDIHRENQQRSRETTISRFNTSLGAMMGSIRGPQGGAVDAGIRNFFTRFQASGGVNIRATELSRALGQLQGVIRTAAAGTGGAQGELLRQLHSILNIARTDAARGGIDALRKGGSEKLLSGNRFEFDIEKQVDQARAQLSTKITNSLGQIANTGLRNALENIRISMNQAANAATNSADKQNALAEATERVKQLGGRATGSDAAVFTALSKAMADGNADLTKNLHSLSVGKMGRDFSGRIHGLTQALGATARYLGPMKRSFDISRSVFSSLNGKFNQFARMQMHISSERGAYGRQVRGANIDFGHMMAAINVGRRHGMDDAAVIQEVSDLQTKLARARWGEGELINDLGRWGLTPFDANGKMKTAHQIQLEQSRKLQSIKDPMEQLQFLVMQGYRPEDKERILNYERDTKRFEEIKKNPRLQGVLERADILDKEGWHAKVDAFTKMELRRRQILNQNAIDEGLGAGIKRMLHPENWFFSDWTARQQGVRQAQGEQAMERLTEALKASVASLEKGASQKDIEAKVLGSLSPKDLAALAEIAKADIKNKGANSGYAMMNQAIKGTFGLEFDLRTPIEKLQDAIVPLLNKLVSWGESIARWLEKSGTAKFMANNPGMSLGIGFAGMMTMAGGRLPGLGLASGLAGGLWKSIVASSGANEVAALASGGGGAGAAATLAAGAAGTVGAAGAARTKVAPKAGEVSLSLRDGRDINAPLPANGGTGAAQTINEVSKVSNNVAKATSKLGQRWDQSVSAFHNAKLNKWTAAVGLAQSGVEAYSEFSQGNTKSGVAAIAGGLGGWGGAAIGTKVGAAIGTAILPGIGTAIGSVLGGIGGWALGEWGTKSLTKAVGGAMGLKDASDQKSIKEKTGDFIKDLQNALNKNDLTRAMKMLEEKGLAGLDVTKLQNDEHFRTNEEYANKVLQQAYYTKSMANYAARTGQKIDQQEYFSAVEKDKYIKAAMGMGVKTDARDIASAVMRQTGHDAAPSFAVAENYLKNGWKLKEDEIAKKTEEYREKDSTLTYSQARKMAEEDVKGEFSKDLSTKDIEYAMKARGEQGKKLLAYNDLAHEASLGLMNRYGFYDGANGMMFDREGYRVTKEGKYVDRKGYVEGNDNFSGKFLIGIKQDESADQKRLHETIRNYLAEHPELMEAGLDEKTLSQAAKDVKASTLKEGDAGYDQALKLEADRQGISMGQFKFANRSERLRQSAVTNAIGKIGSTYGERTIGGALSKFARENDITLDEARNALFTSKEAEGIQKKIGAGEELKGYTKDKWEEYRKGSAYKALEAKAKADAKKAEKAKAAEDVIKDWSDDRIKEVFLSGKVGDEAELSDYLEVRKQRMHGKNALSEKDAKFLDSTNEKLVRAAKKQEKKAKQRGARRGEEVPEDVKAALGRRKNEAQFLEEAGIRRRTRIADATERTGIGSGDLGEIPLDIEMERLIGTSGGRDSGVPHLRGGRASLYSPAVGKRLEVPHLTKSKKKNLHQWLEERKEIDKNYYERKAAEKAKLDEEKARKRAVLRERNRATLAFYRAGAKKKPEGEAGKKDSEVKSLPLVETGNEAAKTSKAMETAVAAGETAAASAKNASGEQATATKEAGTVNVAAPQVKVELVLSQAAMQEAAKKTGDATGEATAREILEALMKIAGGGTY